MANTTRSSTKSIDHRLNAAQVGIDNALNTEAILSQLATYGFTSDKLKEGRALYEKAASERQNRSARFGEQLGATDKMSDVQQKAYREYIRQVKVARVVFQADREAKTKLGLNGARKQDLAGLLEQMRIFYANALADDAVLVALAAYNISKDALACGQQLVEELVEANNLQEQAKGTSGEATSGQSGALKAMDRWMSKYKRTAYIALEETPEYLISLGFR